ncbi:hypothetical protein BDN72DRAFT_851442 [Pluteus cervinus]|uniref:Uncharacterized protein n=1 Tax=Pluteus cervinus TaxID=181527 RepID=A0ACD3A0F8_9AGAR|nr:hypothetical protein BDN72DRAFT_851442 [Pluteus cervinus]
MAEDDLYNWVLSGCSTVPLSAYLSHLTPKTNCSLDSKLAITVSSTNHPPSTVRNPPSSAQSESDIPPNSIHRARYSRMPLRSTSSFSTESTTFDCPTPTRFPSTNEEM